MKTDKLVETVAELADPVARDFGFELVDVEYLSEHGRWVLRVYIDKPGGVTIDDCTEMSRELGGLLDVKDVVPGRYSLEVSSPGLDRPIKKEKDFERFAGRKVNIRMKEPIDGRRNFKASIIGAGEGCAVIEDANGTRFSIPVDMIDRARLVIEI